MGKNLLRFFLFLFVVFSFILPGKEVFALVARTGDSVILESSEVINEDLYVAGREIIIDGTVNGDIVAAGKSIILRGKIRDSAILAGKTLSIAGEVGRGVKAAGQSLVIEGNIKGDLVAAGYEVFVQEKAVIGGDVLFGANEVFLGAPVIKDVIGGGRKITLNGSVKGNVKLAVDTLTLLDGARVGGDLIYMSENEASIHTDAAVEGTITRRLPEYKEKLKKVFPFVLLVGFAGKVLGFFMTIVSGLLFILITPNWLRSMTDSIKSRPGACAGWGAVILFATPVGILVALTTVVGIPLAIIALFLYLTAVYISQITAGLLIGRLILGRDLKIEKRGIMFAAFALGLFILKLLRLVPGFGYFVYIVIALFGIGAIVVSEASRRIAVKNYSQN
jgi:cytoskeletal protein CcmA (bactofilin family)